MNFHLIRLLRHTRKNEPHHRRLGNGLAPVRHQAIIWTNTDLLSIGHAGENENDIFLFNIQLNGFISETAFKNVICIILVILFRPQ